MPAAPASAPAAPASARPDLRFIFFADTHMGLTLTEKFIKEANAARPDLLIDGGDIVEDGSQAEFDRAYADRARLEAPLHMVTGNHDVLRRGTFTHDPPVLPDFQSFDRKGVHFILLNDEKGRMGEDLFSKLEADLEANKGKTTLIALHVPVFVAKLHGYVKLKDLVPFGTATVSMSDKQEVERFKALMKKYGVAAVLSGHTHAPSQATIDGTQYVVAGAVGGKTPGPGIRHEYLDVAVTGKNVQIRRVPLDRAPGNPLSHAIATGNYIARKNALNHSVLGWDTFIPTTSAETRVGLRHTTTRKGEVSDAVTVTGEIETSQHPRGLGSFFVEGTAAIGSREASVDVGAGYKRRLVGDFNRNLYVSGAAVANGGVIGNSLTAGVGARAAVGYEVKNWTFQLSHEKATNRDATMFSVGFRF
ncbi:MAG: metallophosphoesterase family protein [Candidatus Sericytochromatia bacterium]|nr:metallophosphoesterase family protein [Candidatus Tanganyikabacteria bacterium]